MITDVRRQYGNIAADAVSAAISKIIAGKTSSARPIYCFNERIHCKMSEMKIDVGKGFRVYFGPVHGKNEIVGVGLKKTQRNDVKLARHRLETMRHGV